MEAITTEEMLTTETDSKHRCEGQVVTCAHCGRPTIECDGVHCERVLDTGELVLPSRGPRLTLS